MTVTVVIISLASWRKRLRLRLQEAAQPISNESHCLEDNWSKSELDSNILNEVHGASRIRPELEDHARIELAGERSIRSELESCTRNRPLNSLDVTPELENCVRADLLLGQSFQPSNLPT